jgi:hypothetical protein
MKMKIDTGRALETPKPPGGSLSVANFSRSEWEIMYPLFVKEGLINPSECVNFCLVCTVLCAFV